MPARIRKQLYIDPDQERALKRLARRTGRTEAEIMREALSGLLRQQNESEQRRQALENIEDFVRKLMEEVPAARPGRTWKREDLYDRDDKKSA